MPTSSLKDIYENLAKDILTKLIDKAKALSKQWLADQNAELAKSKPGDTVLFGKFTVVQHTNQRLLLEFRTTKVQAGIGFARVRIELADQLGQGDIELEIKSLTLEASL